MFRRKRRRKPVQWLPPIGQQFNTSGAGTPTDVASQNAAVTLTVPLLVVSPAGPDNVQEFPLTIADNPDAFLSGAAAAFGAYQAQNLADVQGFGYSLRRIVGCLEVAVAPAENGQNITPSVVAVTAGLIVRRIASDNPNQSQMAAVSSSQVNPQRLDNATDPWLWRRTWLMSPGNAGPTPSAPSADDGWSQFAGVYQPSNSVFTGMNKTASIDVKGRRVVKDEERLFLNVGVRPVGINPASVDNFEIAFGLYFDYRILATTFVAKSNRRNASR